jgi:hypothetical protein
VKDVDGPVPCSVAVEQVFPVPSGGDFSLSASPASQSLDSGNNVAYPVTVTSSGGFAGSVTLTVTGLPPGGAASFSPTSVSGSGSSTMTIGGENLPTGSYVLTITGSSLALSHRATVTLIVN